MESQPLLFTYLKWYVCVACDLNSWNIEGICTWQYTEGVYTYLPHPSKEHQGLNITYGCDKALIKIITWTPVIAFHMVIVLMYGYVNCFNVTNKINFILLNHVFNLFIQGVMQPNIRSIAEKLIPFETSLNPYIVWDLAHKHEISLMLYM